MGSLVMVRTLVQIPVMAGSYCEYEVAFRTNPSKIKLVSK